jgi:hypothetical protein
MKKNVILIVLSLLMGMRVAVANQKTSVLPSDQTEWVIREYTWENKQNYKHDWNRDGYPEILGVEFRGAGAQIHYNLVLRDGRTEKYIYKSYTFNCPHYGVFEKKGESPIIFVMVLGDLKEVLTSDKKSVIYPAPHPQYATAIVCCCNYYRLIAYRDGRFKDVSFEYPNLLWQLTASHCARVGQDDELDQLWAVELLYYQTRTGLVIPNEWLNAATFGELARKKMLSLIAHFQRNEDRFDRFFQMEKTSLLSGQRK